MSLRFNYRSVNPEAYQIMMQLETFIANSGLDKTLYELIKIRASQINGCAFCLDMHTTTLLKMGDSMQRINLISVWREVPDLYTDQEKMVLELTEAITLISYGGVSSDLYERARAFFSEKEYVDVIMAVNTINCWNRMAISTGMYPGCF